MRDLQTVVFFSCCAANNNDLNMLIQGFEKGIVKINDLKEILSAMKQSCVDVTFKDRYSRGVYTIKQINVPFLQQCITTLETITI